MQIKRHDLNNGLIQHVLQMYMDMIRVRIIAIDLNIMIAVLMIVLLVLRVKIIVFLVQKVFGLQIQDIQMDIVQQHLKKIIIFRELVFGMVLIQQQLYFPKIVTKWNIH